MAPRRSAMVALLLLPFLSTVSARCLYFAKVGTEWNVPKIVHFVWMGNPISDAGKRNLEAWAAANKNGYELWLWTDKFETQGRKDEVPHGIEHKDLIAHIATADDSYKATFQTFYDLANGHDGRDRAFRGYYPSASDLFRYYALYSFGGMYSDIDIAPGNFDFSAMKVKTLPFSLAPLVRDTNSVKRATGKDAITEEDIYQVAQDRVADPAALGNGGPWINNNVIKAPKKNCFLKKFMEEVAWHVAARQVTVLLPDPNQPDPAAWTGPAAMNVIWRENKYSKTSRASTVDIIKGVAPKRVKAVTDKVGGFDNYIWWGFKQFLANAPNPSVLWVTPESDNQVDKHGHRLKKMLQKYRKSQQ